MGRVSKWMGYYLTMSMMQILICKFIWLVSYTCMSVELSGLYMQAWPHAWPNYAIINHYIFCNIFSIMNSPFSHYLWEQKSLIMPGQWHRVAFFSRPLASEFPDVTSLNTSRLLDWFYLNVIRSWWAWSGIMLNADGNRLIEKTVDRSDWLDTIAVSVFA